MGKWIVGNWKMNGSLELSDNFVPALVEGMSPKASEPGNKVALCPPAPYLLKLADSCENTPLQVGAQNIHPKASGAFTGEISPAILKDLGITLCIIGHSERRQMFGDTNSFVAEKLASLLAEGITPILCVGETLEEREANRQEAVVGEQVKAALEGVTPEQGKQLSLAYEPVWAIGTGRTATPEQANSMHQAIRGMLQTKFGEEIASGIPLLYGGSVNPENAEQLMGQTEINGVLVGGASLKPEQFRSIINQGLS